MRGIVLPRSLKAREFTCTMVGQGPRATHAWESRSCRPFPFFGGNLKIFVKLRSYGDGFLWTATYIAGRLSVF